MAKKIKDNGVIFDRILRLIKESRSKYVTESVKG